MLDIAWVNMATIPHTTGFISLELINVADGP